ncbi:peptide deformylase [Buchnera aphidicola]|uniref:Peptide deformylase n=1 Tax=Buchnera aphidicola subsp. Tuberolachnus salignus TaxID=98804 RepID=A0A170PC79_BUCTT|nr:peptide deformylase [Buchnera aphidicola]CUR53293.1 Peptide deformylase [Buchnera aphidicola (Tuberolachnus salignus)]
MTIQKILQFPDLKLRKIAKPVKKINQKIHKIIYDMFDTMHYFHGIGLAATQINIHKQIIVISPINPIKNYLILINPKILKKKNPTNKFEEGCLSVQKKKAYLIRSNNITIQALDYYGRPFILKAKKLLSICIQHEMDHLIGKLFIDYLK